MTRSSSLPSLSLLVIFAAAYSGGGAVANTITVETDSSGQVGLFEDADHSSGSSSSMDRDDDVLSFLADKHLLPTVKDIIADVDSEDELVALSRRATKAWREGTLEADINSYSYPALGDAGKGSAQCTEWNKNEERA